MCALPLLSRFVPMKKRLFLLLLVSGLVLLAVGRWTVQGSAVSGRPSLHLRSVVSLVNCFR